MANPLFFTKYIRSVYMSSPLTWDNCDDFMTGLGNLFCYQFGLRVSECCYQVAPDRNHAIMAGDVAFYRHKHPGTSKPLHPWDLQPGNHFYICPPVKKTTTATRYYVALDGEHSGVHQDIIACNSLAIPVSTRIEGAQMLLTHSTRKRHEISSNSIKLIQVQLRSQKNHQTGKTRT